MIKKGKTAYETLVQGLIRGNWYMYIIILIVLLFCPFFFFHFSRDASVYAYMGTLFFEDKIPYIDGWDHKGITIYLINAFGYLIGFKSYIGIRIVELVLVCVAFIQIYNALLVTYSKKIAFTAVVFGILALRYFFDGGNLTEEYGAIFSLLTLSYVLKRNKSSIYYVLIGALFVLSFTIRANLISLWIALFLTYNCYYVLLKKPIKKLLGIYLKISIGIVLMCIPLTIYFLKTHSFTAFYNAAFTYNFSYSKLSFGAIIGAIIKSTRLYEVSLVMLLAFLISTVSLLKKRLNFIAILLFFWVPIELYLGNMSGKGYAHYYMMWVPVIVLSTAFVIDYFKKELISKEKRFVLLAIVSFLFFQIPIFSTIRSYNLLLTGDTSKNERIALHINKTYKNQSVLIWGNECSIYNLTGKVAPVRNFYQTIFKLNSKLTKEMILAFTKEIKRNSPHIIVDVKTPSLLFLDKTNVKSIGLYQKENLVAFFTFFQENYQLKETINGTNYYLKNQ